MFECALLGVSDPEQCSRTEQVKWEVLRLVLDYERGNAGRIRLIGAFDAGATSC